MASFERRKDQDGKTSIRVKVRLKGHPVQTATLPNLTLARVWAASIESAIREGRHFPTNAAKRRSVSELIERYEREVLPTKAPGTAHTQALQLAWWRKAIGDYRLADVTPAVLVECRDRLAAEPGRFGKQRSGSTVNRYLAVFSHLLTLASREWNLIADNPAKRVTRKKESTGRTRILSPDERIRLLETCRTSRNKDLYPAVVLALATAARRMEILALRWPYVDLEAGLLTFPQTKNGVSRTVPVRGLALDLLKERSRVRRIDTDRVFPGVRDPKQPATLKDAFLTAVNKADLGDFRWHDLRHSAATTLAAAGVSPIQLAELLGHRTLQMTRRYSHLSKDHLEGLADTLAAALDIEDTTTEETEA